MSHKEVIALKLCVISSRLITCSSLFSNPHGWWMNGSHTDVSCNHSGYTSIYGCNAIVLNIQHVTRVSADIARGESTGCSVENVLYTCTLWGLVLQWGEVWVWLESKDKPWQDVLTHDIWFWNSVMISWSFGELQCLIMKRVVLTNRWFTYEYYTMTAWL